MSFIKAIYTRTTHPFLIEVKASLKSLDIEEDYDLVLSRTVGLFFAKIAERLSLTPTNVSMASLLTGVVGGGLFVFQDNLPIVLLGSALLVISGILDSSDGQLARRTKQYTQLGKVIDGVIDSLVFISCYVAGAWFFLDAYGMPLVALAAISGFLHSLQSLIYDFYKNDYMFIVGNADHSKNPTPPEVEKMIASSRSIKEKIIYFLYKDYVGKQRALTFRPPAMSIKMRQLVQSNPGLFQDYRRSNLWLLKLWALATGSNTHRTLIILFGLIGRFDLYLVVNVALTVPTLIIGYLQYRSDHEFCRLS